jgi:septal ring factor EnvC (AmiA/AmiB activator)
MVSEKTPPHKRIARAEKGREEWKTKAIQRREETERLALEVKAKNVRLKELKDEIYQLKSLLEESNDRISRIEKESEKKPFK